VSEDPYTVCRWWWLVLNCEKLSDQLVTYVIPSCYLTKAATRRMLNSPSVPVQTALSLSSPSVRSVTLGPFHHA